MAITLQDIRARFYEAIVEGCARTLWVMAYADYNTHNGICDMCAESIVRASDADRWENSDGEIECPDGDRGEYHVRDNEESTDPLVWPAARPGQDWNKVAPATPAAAYVCAEAIIQTYARQENATITDLFELAMTIDKGEFEWLEEDRERSRTSEERNELRQEKLEAAEEFGASLAWAIFEAGVGWGDNHRTRRDGAEFKLAPVRGTFEMADADLIRWSIDAGRQSGVDTVLRHIGLGGPLPASTTHVEAATMELAEWIDVDPDDLMGFESVAEFAANAIDDEVRTRRMNDGREPISASSDDPMTAFYRIPGNILAAVSPPPPPAERATTAHLLGFMPEEREWTYFFVTKSIGRIIVVETPTQGDGHINQNYVLWFGQGTPTLLLVFRDSLDDALGVCVDEYISDNAPGLLADDEVREEYQRLVREKLDEKGLPDESMLSDRELDAIRKEAEVDTTTAGNYSNYLHSDEWGVYGENMTLDELKRAGDIVVVQKNPGTSSRKPLANTTFTKIPIRTRTSAARSPRQ